VLLGIHKGNLRITSKMKYKNKRHSDKM